MFTERITGSTAAFRTPTEQLHTSRRGFPTLTPPNSPQRHSFKPQRPISQPQRSRCELHGSSFTLHRNRNQATGRLSRFTGVDIRPTQAQPARKSVHAAVILLRNTSINHKSKGRPHPWDRPYVNVNLSFRTKGRNLLFIQGDFSSLRSVEMTDGNVCPPEANRQRR